MLNSSKRRGVALATVLLCSVALILILFTAVSASLSHLKMVTAAANQEHARNLAEAALAKAISRLVETDYKFGKPGQERRVDVTVTGLEDAVGTVTFDSGEAGFGSGYSTHNFESDADKLGARGHQVPGRSVHLVARGKVGDTESWMECVYYKPPFPDGLATTGPIKADALTLKAVRRSQAYSGGDPNAINPDEQLQANLFSNSTTGFPGLPAASIGPNCDISGSAGAVGSVGVDPSSIVRGEVLPGSQARSIPELDVRRKIDALKPNAATVSSGGSLKLDEKWYSKSEGPLSISGDLDLNGSALVVEGNLSVTGAIKGTGVVLVDGSVEIRDGRSSITTNDQVAIGCTGDFTLRAESPEGNYFQGLLYSEGNLTAKDITVLGAMVVHGKTPDKGSATLDNVRMVYSPSTVEMELGRAEGFDLSDIDGGEPDHQIGTAASIRRADNGKDYLLDITVVFSDVDKTNEDQNPDKLENGDFWKDLPREWWIQYDQAGAILSKDGNDHLEVKHWSSLNLGPDPENLRLDQLRPITEFIKNLADKKRGANEDFSIDDIKLVVKGKIDRTIRSGDNYSLSFNLNNLLAELMGSSRVLIWRPFK